MVVSYRGEEVETHYRLEGEYIPRSYECEGEYPDLIFEGVYYNDVDVLPLMSQSDVEELKEIMYNELF